MIKSRYRRAEAKSGEENPDGINNYDVNKGDDEVNSDYDCELKT